MKYRTLPGTGISVSNLAWAPWASAPDLADEETTRLDQVSTPTPDSYPYGAFGVKQCARYVDSSDQAIQELF